MNPLLEKLLNLWPEMTLLIAAVLCLGLGLARTQATRQLTAPIAAIACLIATLLALTVGEPLNSGVGLGAAGGYFRVLFPLLAFILILVCAAVPNRLPQTIQAESGPEFQPGRSNRGEFFAFALLSTVGAMLTAGADDLVWLFLALELTSLPTYVMVATSRNNPRAQEAAVKYFFLGAFSAAIFLYGFALIYGATGATDFTDIRNAIAAETASTGTLTPLLTTGVLLAVLGIAFKLAAFPMHFYAADVYQGAATPVTAFLAVIPKTAGFSALILIMAMIGWPLDKNPTATDAGEIIAFAIAAIAVLTMTAGNLLALVQTNVKRMLAYSSVAHSGYLLIPVIVGPALTGGASGLAALLFYLPAYAAGTIACFAALAALPKEPEDGHTYDDLNGLRATNPLLAICLAVGALSLLGLPPLIGFVGKLHIMTAGLADGHVALITILIINSAISAGYYLRLAAGPMILTRPTTPAEEKTPSHATSKLAIASACIAATLALALGLFGGPVLNASTQAARLSLEKQTPAIESRLTLETQRATETK